MNLYYQVPVSFEVIAEVDYRGHWYGCLLTHRTGKGYFEALVYTAICYLF